jgi:hypothetical protein
MSPQPVAEHSRLRRFAARALLLAGAAVVGTYIAARVPREQTLVFQPGSTPVASLQATWAESGGEEPLGGVTLTFPSPTTRAVRHRVSLPNGEYDITIQLTLEPDSSGEPTADGDQRGAPTPRAQTTVVERVRLGGGDTFIALGPKGSD